MIRQLRHAFQRNLRGRGIEIRKTPPPFDFLSVFRLALQARMAQNGDALRFVQIGANDGVYGDPLRAFILNRGWSGVLVEPQPDVFERLKANYAQCGDRLVFENVAISREASLTLFLPPVGGTPTVSEVDDKSVVSAKADVIARQLRIPKSALVQIDVPAMTLDALMAKHQITELDLLQIDAEGLDWAILQTLDLAKVKPALIQVETGHLTRTDLAEMARHLNSSGYKLYYGGWQGDTLAIRDDTLIVQ